MRAGFWLDLAAGALLFSPVLFMLLVLACVHIAEWAGLHIATWTSQRDANFRRRLPRAVARRRS
jgi:hypothetical protein